VRNPTAKVAVFVDINNFYRGALKRYNRRIDYKKFMAELVTHGQVYIALAYGIGDDVGTDSFKALLRHAGFECRWADARYNWNVGITVDVVRQIDLNKVDLVILASGDPFLARCAEYVRQQGLKCYSYGFQISDSMRQAVDRFFEIPESFLIECET
jgi:uncharacterized LabA/DUF88 family protein